MTPGSRALIGLRGVAALFVISHHLYVREGLHLPLLHQLALRGYLAVDLFFVLSGFTMAWIYGGWFTRQITLPVYLEFMWRRVARLWPLHAAMVLVVIVEYARRGLWPFWPKMIAANLLMVQNWGWSQVINPPSWSVSTEMLAYLLFPMLAAAALHGRPARAWAGCAAAVGLVLLAVWLAPFRGPGRRGALDIYDNWSLLPALRCLGGFWLGMLTYRALQTAWVAAIARRPGVAVAAGLVLLLLLAAGAPDLLVYAAFPVLTAALFAGAGAPQAWLGTRVLHGLGTLSYAIYLVHVPILEVVAIVAGQSVAVLVPVFFSVTLVAALLAHRLIERPSRALLRRVRPTRWLLQAG